MLTKLLNPIYAFIVNILSRWESHRKKQRSEYELSKLSDYLLDDIGMRRIDDEIVPLNKRVFKNFSDSSGLNHGGRGRLVARKRLRHPYLLRRREE